MMCPNQLVASITAAAATIAQGRSEGEVAMLAAMFTQLGDTLATLVVARERCDSLSSRDPDKRQ